MLDPLGRGGLHERLAERGAVRVRERHVGGLRAVVERVRPALGEVDRLIADHERPRRDLLPEGSRGARPEHAGHPEVLQRPHVRPVGDLVRGEPMVRPVAREERDPPVAHRADRERRGGRAERRLHLHGLGVLQELVEARPPDDTDLRSGLRHDAAGSFFDGPSFFDPSPQLADEGSFDPVDPCRSSPRSSLRALPGLLPRALRLAVRLRVLPVVGRVETGSLEGDRGRRRTPSAGSRRTPGTSSAPRPASTARSRRYGRSRDTCTRRWASQAGSVPTPLFPAGILPTPRVPWRA